MKWILIKKDETIKGYIIFWLVAFSLAIYGLIIDAYISSICIFFMIMLSLYILVAQKAFIFKKIILFNSTSLEFVLIATGIFFENKNTNEFLYNEKKYYELLRFPIDDIKLKIKINKSNIKVIYSDKYYKYLKFFIYKKNNAFKYIINKV